VPLRATVKGWNLPSVGWLTEKKRIRWLSRGGGEVPQGGLPTPEQPQWLNLEVTEAGGAGGEDFFEFEVHTPDTLHRVLETHGALLGRGIVVVVEEYDPERVAEEMRPLVESVEGRTWEEVAFRVGSLGPWEFEGWKWYPEEEELRPDPGVEAEVREVRLLRTAIGDSFDLPIELRFGLVGGEEEVTVRFRLQSPLWVRNQLPPDGILVGSGRVFGLHPDPEAIASALAATSPVARAPSWDLLRLSLQPIATPSR
jgi:hypothetical protein